MMNPSLLQQAITFREVMDQPINTCEENVHELQAEFINEEYKEWKEAFDEEHDGILVVEQLKELADLVFVCYQYAAARGWNLDVAMRRVFESNMSKLVDGKPLRRADGKVLKGPYYYPPFLDDLV
jgi:NTP pyrophosphatase (non-canonical NTP hydrolase)